MLSKGKKRIRAFLKQRIDFHYEGFRAAKKAMKRAIDLRKEEAAAKADAERLECLRNAAKDQRELANWHLKRAGKMRKKKSSFFPKRARGRADLLSLRFSQSSFFQRLAFFKYFSFCK